MSDDEHRGEMVITSERVIQEYVPGKQITIAHIISRPDETLYSKLGLKDVDGEAVGILNISPSEAAVIAVNIALKTSEVEIGFIDRFSGSIAITGSISAVTIAIETVTELMEQVLGFPYIKTTKS